MVPVSYIVTAIVSAAFGSVTTIFMLSITNEKGSDQRMVAAFCAISRKQIKYMTLIGICAMTICTKKEENYFSAICFNRRMISSF